MMTGTEVFWMQILTSVGVVSAISVWYVWPRLKRMPRNAALIALLFVHVPRYLGMALFVPNIVDAALPRYFLSSAAYGDLVEAAFAFICICALRSNWRGAIPLVWATNIWGFLDLLNGLRGVIQLDVPSFDLRTFWYVYTFYAPVVVVTHIMIFWALMKPGSWKNSPLHRTSDDAAKAA